MECTSYFKTGLNVTHHGSSLGNDSRRTAKGFKALGFSVMRGSNGVELLSILSKNFNWGRCVTLAFLKTTGFSWLSLNLISFHAAWTKSQNRTDRCYWYWSLYFKIIVSANIYYNIGEEKLNSMFSGLNSLL